MFKFTKTVPDNSSYADKGDTKEVLNIPKVVGVAVSSILAFSVLMGSFYIVGGTEYAVERTPGGEMQGIVEPGIHFKVPFLSSVHFYDQFQTVSYVDDDEDPETIGSLKRINFADTYGGYVGGTIRYQLSANPDLLVELHKAYLNEKNLILAGLKPVSKQLLTYTANQITGENFMQGGQNDYQIRIEDQGNKGLYITKRIKVKVEKNRSSVSVKNQNPTDRKQRESYVYKTVIQKDDKGVPLRQELPTTRYGIKIVQVTIDDFKPEQKLKEFVNRKKDQIAKRQTLIEEQENERQSAVTAELKGNRQRVEARQSMLKEKDAAVIQADKQVSLESKAAELQVVRKQKELDIAKANLGIQTANAKAAIQQAKAIKATGLAKATVKKAMYDAVDPDILAMEVQRANVAALTTNLKDFKVQMPTYSVNNGSGTGGSANSLDTIMNVIGIKNLQELSPKAK